ncbi:6-phospho-3-hexuloisomerase [Pedobacter gandavensis]|uniref:6-phospho-3-hexuloisomerase n=1 Tax=Pedobacter gandavensis TaxID=2679963 RepID=A0ABR6EWV0_9SPHI|nr:6-phospho-3-hexuloisomerase [Pedobacter gandavensis]MBB2148903.1 6-phospho-3-hexuloisomerase [Pedobacter gandavensis]
MEVITTTDKQLAKEVRNHLEMILMENTWLLKQINFEEVAVFANTIKTANHIFIIAAGRSGFAMRSAAMRLMHLGLNVHFVGETTTPAIKEGDLLIAASGSGTTSSIVKAAEKAKSVGAQVLALSTQSHSLLANIADQLILIPAAEKEDHEGSRSRQYAGSLFEQFLLLLTDAVFQTLWKMDDTANTELWKRHANLE